MHFKRLRLNGFKSFIDPTELLIEEGITGIVGPNGCGKSNLLEALRWVMGESSAKSMRGTGMDDVIFAGTDRRSPRPYAEVQLTIDNSDHFAPAQFNHEKTLDISRKITRDMGSSYRVNGKEVRARDLQILFADAATGSNSPSLVRQGQISQLIHAKPKQRRAILEDASGIGGLYSRRREAELRLKAAQQNLERVEDILKTTETQINSLRRQAKQAEKYRILSSEIRKTEGLHLAVLYARAASEKELAERDLRDISLKVAKSEIKASQLLQQEINYQEQVAPLREELAIASAILKNTEIEATSLKGKISEAENRIYRLERGLENIAKDRKREDDLLQDADIVLQRLETELSEMGAAESDSPEEIAALEGRLEAGQTELSDHEARLEQLRNDISDLQSRNKSLTETANQARGRQLRLEKDYIGLSEQEKQASLALTEDFATQMLEDKRQNLADQLAEKTALLQTYDMDLEALHTEESEARKALLEAEKNLNIIHAEIKGLTALSEGAEKQQGKANILDQITLHAGYEKAFGVVFGDDISFDDNPQQPRYWRLLPSEKMQAKITFPENIRPLSDYVKAVPDFLRLALARVGVLTDETQAEHLQDMLMPGTILVSQSGKLWRSDGFVIADGRETQTSLLLEQKNRLIALKGEEVASQELLSAAQRTYEDIKKRHLDMQTDQRKARQACEDMNREQQQLERKILTVQNALTVAESKLKGLTERRELIERELQEANQAAEQALAALESISGTDALREEAELLKSLVTEKRNNLSDIKAHLESAKRAIKERDMRLKSLQKDKADWEGRSAKARQRLAECDRRRDHVTRDLQQARSEPDLLYRQRDEVQSKLATAGKRFEEAKSSSEGLEGELSVVTKALRQVQSEVSDQRELKARLETTLEGAVQSEQDILTRIAEKIANTPEELRAELEVKPDETTPDLHIIEENLRSLNMKRDGLGPVNLVAEKELTEIEAQSLALIAEKDDLLAAIKKLSGAIADINKEGRVRITKAFDIVNNHFKKLFQHLFSGGVAELALVESDDPLEAGLEIHARPPGKKTSTLSLLSGGEQALTCMALIFAVFLTNPSPICVLDEVDAPLDDANVERYCNLITEMTKVTDTRFLVITHNALTMARADRLFGVTMSERGVSQLVSVDLKAAEKLVDE
ncbi:MAG: chromosome segregation protein SMC [Pseudomonadota bacterium]